MAFTCFFFLCATLFIYCVFLLTNFLYILFEVIYSLQIKYVWNNILMTILGDLPPRLNLWLTGVSLLSDIMPDHYLIWRVLKLINLTKTLQNTKIKNIIKHKI